MYYVYNLRYYTHDFSKEAYFVFPFPTSTEGYNETYALLIWLTV